MNLLDSQMLLHQLNQDGKRFLIVLPDKLR